MNIFILDADPVTAAEMYCDKHVPKMVVELYQQMGSALRRHGATDDQMPLTQAGKPLKGGYHHHPCTQWVGDSMANYAWAWLHAKQLCREYTLRYGKQHFCESGIDRMGYFPIYEMFDWEASTPYAQAMPDEYKNSDAVEAYRTYYWCEKRRFAKWEKGTPVPEWWEDAEKEGCEGAFHQELRRS